MIGARRYFNVRYWARRYWPKTGESVQIPGTVRLADRLVYSASLAEASGRVSLSDRQVYSGNLDELP